MLVTATPYGISNPSGHKFWNMLHLTAPKLPTSQLVKHLHKAARWVQSGCLRGPLDVRACLLADGVTRIEEAVTVLRVCLLI